MRIKGITSYLEFKFYKQDNISHDTGQIFTVTFFLKNNTYVNITNIIVLQCLQSPHGILAHSILFGMSGRYFSFCKILIRIFTIPIQLAVMNQYRFSICSIFSLLNLVHIFPFLVLDQIKIDQFIIMANNYIALAKFQQCSRHFKSFNPYMNNYQYFSPFVVEETGIERFNNLLKVTQLLTSGARM